MAQACNVDKVLKYCVQGYENMGFHRLYSIFYDERIEIHVPQYAFEVEVILSSLEKLKSYMKKHKHTIESTVYRSMENYFRYCRAMIERRENRVKVGDKVLLRYNRDSFNMMVKDIFSDFATICVYLFRERRQSDAKVLLSELIDLEVLDFLQSRDRPSRWFYTLLLNSIQDTYKDKKMDNPLYTYLSSLTVEGCDQFLNHYIMLFEIVQVLLVDKKLPAVPKRKGGNKSKKRRRIGRRTRRRVRE